MTSLTSVFLFKTDSSAGGDREVAKESGDDGAGEGGVEHEDNECGAHGPRRIAKRRRISFYSLFPSLSPSSSTSSLSLSPHILFL